MGELAADCRSAAGVCGAEVRGGAGTLDRLIQGGLLFRQGVLPQASYLFKHALVQDAAYGTRLREPRRALHARIAEILESRFADTAESRPEILAHHCTEAALMRRPRVYGARRVSSRSTAQRRSKPRPSLAGPLSRSRPCPARRPCVASRLNYRWRSSPHSSMSKATPPRKPRRQQRRPVR